MNMLQAFQPSTFLLMKQPPLRSAYQGCVADGGVFCAADRPRNVNMF